MALSNKPMRRTALIQTWGVGAIVPFPHDESLMIAGLDAWRYNNPHSMIIQDNRLSKRIGVKELRWPPDYRDANVDPENWGLTIPAVRFPTWHYCPWCGYMRNATLYETQPTCACPDWANGRKCDPHSRFRRKMVPERFIVICKKGHIDDFPVAEWLHSDDGYQYNPDSCVIRRSTGGTSAALTGVFYECTCGAKKSLAGATAQGALHRRINYYCKGSRPWLGDAGNGCDCDPKEDIRVVLRGATNVWFSDTRSSILIPAESTAEDKRIAGLVDQYYDNVSQYIVNGQLDKGIIGFIASTNRVDPDDLYQAFLDRMNNGASDDNISENMSEDEYRLSEYKVLCKSSGSDSQDFHSINLDIDNYNSLIQPFFKSISLVPKLKETCAFVGFSRVEPQSSENLAAKRAELRLGNENWLPAIQVCGEGIFFEFNDELIKQWANKENVKKRIDILNSSFKKARFGENTPGDLHPEFVLIHTFAHLLINQLSFECGYGSSSIRERVYCEKTGDEHKMHGVLIYTASGDAEGSMGGLVRQGKPGHLEDTIRDAVQNATWCTSDPVCIQSRGQGPESLNLAACHNCGLLPETCCEVGNRLLDRGVVVGTLTEPDVGFFHALRE